MNKLILLVKIIQIIGIAWCWVVDWKIGIIISMIIILEFITSEIIYRQYENKIKEKSFSKDKIAEYNEGKEIKKDDFNKLKDWLSSDYIEKLKSNGNEELFKKLYMGEFNNFLPEYNRPVIAVIKKCGTEIKKEVELIAVDETDCIWRFLDDNSEIDYGWDVISWRYKEINNS